MNEVSVPIEATRAVEDYIASWNERDAGRRGSLIAQTWTQDGSYVDPHLSAEGQEGIDTMIGEAQRRFPGHHIALAAGPDAHHDRVRFIWHLLGPEAGEPVAIGMDVATLAADGRMREVIGFRGPLE